MNRIYINTKEQKSTINRNIYGHFAEHLGRCIYNGIFVGDDSTIPNEKGMRKDVVEALRNIKIPVLRWPGGCFADEYHWKDGIGEKASRKKMVNTHWGGVVEDNSFGTHEFMELCRQLHCEPYINGNVGSGTVQEMSEWVEYLTFDGVSPMAELREKNGKKDAWRVKYWGVGNENWGCGGNMRPEFYADVYRQFATYIRNYGENKIYKIACGAPDFNYDWTDKVMQIAAKHMDALTLHYYTFVAEGDFWEKKLSATDFDEPTYYKTLHKAMKMDEIITKHAEIMSKYDPTHRVGIIVDEWGTWFAVEPGTNPGFLYQQNTMRDAMVAGLTLNIFNQHSNRVEMANLAQTVNVLQAVILTEGDKMVLTPTYHVFDLFKHHHDAKLVHSYTETTQIGGDFVVPNVQASASVDENGVLTATLVNPSVSAPAPVELLLTGIEGKNATGRILTGAMQDYNDFDKTDNVKILPFNGITLSQAKAELTLPPCSVVEVRVST
ncbi:MAG: alpha-N-arabinofuranosidase [Defluviitaleaceae bacterium]|nr:alpha-N-arabinofuranosidase [Defluviitaleaceae bacterium]MCL2273989.1 alpha-N-arabinofuranosidase [Defluviitaleaceae bacterium]MCL2274110.1 alpha-N-arabinofuranosidase [Defluviitaleaceae bacterium]